MKTMMSKRISITTAALVFATTSGLLAQTPLGTDFTYQGQLKSAGIAALSTADFQFLLFDAESDGLQIGATLSKPNVGIVNGLFTISLDFGGSAFQGDARWIEVAVRSPAGSGGFTTLSPRQPLTAAPYALQTRGITVDASDRVGIGTQTPAKKLTVAGDMELGTSSGDYRHMRIGGGNSDGFLYGSFAALGDGIHMGYNYFADAVGAHQVIHADGATSRISMRYGSIALATGGINTPPANRLTIDQVGNVNVNGALSISSVTRSYTLHGFEFMGVNGADQFFYDTDGLHSSTETGTGVQSFFVASPHLPDGATILAMEMIGFDGFIVANMICTLGRTNFAGERQEMAEVESLTGGSVWQTTDIVSPTVDNDTHAYWIYASLQGGNFPDNQHRLTAVRLIYSITQPLP